jgi:SAM-dependent methyltransferase
MTLATQTEELNRAAERYYAKNVNPQHLLDKPFSEPEAAARRFIDVGVLIDSLRLQPGDVVMELGAGTCWVSHLLNLCGYKTVAVDVSATALSMGRTRFERDPRTNWTLDPQFLAYDGHKLPVGDAAVDHVLLYDAYHHLPNPGELLREMRRVVRSGGIVAMSEPGRGTARAHRVLKKSPRPACSKTSSSSKRSPSSRSRRDSLRLALSSPPISRSWKSTRCNCGRSWGQGFARYWRDLCASLDGHHYVLLFADDPQPTTRRPKRLKCIITIPESSEGIRMQRGERKTLHVDLFNAGDTRWLHGESGPGWTRLGAHLYRVNSGRTLVDFDCLRVALPHDVAPEQQARIDVTLPAIEAPGSYLVVIDLVIEGSAWFADRGSIPLSVSCVVSEGRSAIVSRSGITNVRRARSDMGCRRDSAIEHRRAPAKGSPDSGERSPTRRGRDRRVKPFVDRSIAVVIVS